MPETPDPPTTRDMVASGYPEALVGIKAAIAEAHVRAARTVNIEMIQLYWRIGHIILDRQQRHRWGTKVIQRLSTDLRAAYPGRRGFSISNLDYMRRFAAAFPTGPISQQPIGRLGWGSVTILLDKFDTPEERAFYAARAAQSGWSQAVLRDRIRGRLHLREGGAPSTFERTLPAAEQPAAQELARDPWIFDFLRLDRHVSERDVERALVDNLAEVLVELGTGFAYMGRQFRLVIGGDELFLDLLFYHVRLHRYVVFELKVGKFLAEHTGKLSLYLSAVDELISDPTVDGSAIGILLVTERNDHVVEFALRGIDQPMAVSRYTYRELPSEVRGALPDADTLVHGVEAAAARARRQLADPDLTTLQ